MSDFSWRDRAGTAFTCEKQPATGTRGMVVTNHPLASADGARMLAAGGNAFDAAITALFSLTVVEPMMVGILGGGIAHVRFRDGRHSVIDGMARAPLASRPDIFTPVSDRLPDYLETEGRENAVGVRAVAAPGNLLAWSEILQRFGSVPLSETMAPAIQHASTGFRVTPYLSECIADAAADLSQDPEISRIFMPGGVPARAGSTLVMRDYADTLRAIAAQGPATLHGGALGHALADYFRHRGGLLAMADFEQYRTIGREAVRGHYRGHDIIGPPPPSSGGIHVLQMLNLLEGFDIAGMGFGSPAALHLLAEVTKIAFADRKAATADPDHVAVPVERVLSTAYADLRRSEIDPERAKQWSAGVSPRESPSTTHVTLADGNGNIVAMTQTINSTFGARIIVPGTGLIPNNYLHVFDPHPGQALSIAPGKRVTTSMAPIMVLKDGRPILALGLPGGLRIFPSVMQALVSVIDHGMALQEAVEAPRLWTQGGPVEMEEGFPEVVRDELAAMGHEISCVPHVGGGMNAIGFGRDGILTGAACWRADGTPVALSGGLARPGIRFWPDRPRR